MIEITGMSPVMVERTERVVTLDTLKARLKIRHDLLDSDLQLMIDAATDMAEKETRRSIALRRWRLTLPGFPAAALALPRPPLVSVEALRYFDTDDHLQMIDSDDYWMDRDDVFARLVPKTGRWPAAAARPGAVEIEYTAGYGMGCPEPVVNWILLVCAVWDRQGGAVNIGNIVNRMPYADELLEGYKILLA